MTQKQNFSTLDILSELVAFDTISSKSNLPLITFIEEFLKNFGIKTQRFPNADGNKAALLATIGPQNQPGIILSGHTDVVPVEGQCWSSQPFQLTLSEGKAYGRGAVDMKGFIASVLASVPYFISSQLKTPVHLLFSYDEEISCLGCIDAIDWLVKNNPKPIAAIVGEPTMMQIVDAHKNVAEFETRIFGREAHSALPQLGTSAIMAAGDLIAEIGKIADRLEKQKDKTGRFDPPYTTLHVASIKGDSAANILARECRFIWEIRCLPDQKFEDILDEVKNISKQIVEQKMNRFGSYGSIKTETLYSIPGLAAERDSRACQLVAKILGQKTANTVSYATEGGYFQIAGISTVICGPGSIDQAHKPDEYISLEQLERCDIFMKKLAHELSGNSNGENG